MFVDGLLKNDLFCSKYFFECNDDFSKVKFHMQFANINIAKRTYEKILKYFHSPIDCFVTVIIVDGYDTYEKQIVELTYDNLLEIELLLYDFFPYESLINTIYEHKKINFDFCDFRYIHTQFSCYVRLGKIYIR